MTEHQRLVDRRRYLGDKDRISCFGIGLRAVGVIGVHRVPQLVRDREDLARRLLVVEQDVRMRAVRAPRIGATALALVLADVDPPLGERLVEQLAVLFPERREPLLDEFACVVVFQLELRVLDDRHMQVVHVQFVQAQPVAAQFEIARQKRDVLLHALDQPVVDGARHVLTRRRAVEAARIFARTRIERIFFDVAAIQRGDRVDVVFERAVHALERLFAVFPDGRMHLYAVNAVSEPDLFARAVDVGSELDVGVVEHAERVLRGVGERARHREQLLFARRQRMPCRANERTQHIIVVFEVGIGCELGEFCLAQRDQLRGDERRAFRQPDHRGLRPVAPLLRGGIADVFVAAHRRKDIDPLGAERRLVVEFEATKHAVAVFESAVECGEFVAVFRQLGKLLFPDLIRRDDVLEAPFVTLFYLFSLHINCRSSA